MADLAFTALAAAFFAVSWGLLRIARSLQGRP